MQIKPNNLKNSHKKTHKLLQAKILTPLKLTIKLELNQNLKMRKNLSLNQLRKCGIFFF